MLFPARFALCLLCSGLPKSAPAPWSPSNVDIPSIERPHQTSDAIETPRHIRKTAEQRRTILFQSFMLSGVLYMPPEVLPLGWGREDKTIPDSPTGCRRRSWTALREMHCQLGWAYWNIYSGRYWHCNGTEWNRKHSRSIVEPTRGQRSIHGAKCTCKVARSRRRGCQRGCRRQHRPPRLSRDIA